MKAAIYHGIKDIRVGEWPKPACGPGEVLIEVHYCAICGTDVRIYFHGHKNVAPPAVVGHEISGVVAAIGEGVNVPGLAVGDPVTTVTSIGCGTCKVCAEGFYNLCPATKAIGYAYPGGFAEYVAVPASAVAQNALVKLPKNTSLLDGTLIEPLSCAINGQRYLAIGPTDTVVIYGGGPIGMMHASLAQARSAAKVIVVDPDFERLERFGRAFPGLLLWNPKTVNVREAVMKETGGFGADVVITACPAKQAQVDGIGMLGSRGRISLFGGLPKDDSVISIDANIIHYKELSVFGAFASNRRDYVEAAGLISEGKIPASRFISKVVPLESIADGIAMVRGGDVLKVVVEVRPHGT